MAPRENSLSESALTGTDVQTWTFAQDGAKYTCFRNARGELFHFKNATLMRGKPKVPFNTIEEFCRPATMLTVENAAHMVGLTPTSVKFQIHAGRLRATRKKWRYGNCRRWGLLIDIADLYEFMAKHLISDRYRGRAIDWDVPVKSVLDAIPRNRAKDSQIAK